ncbi:hypothetical protein KFK14_13015 [Sphingobium phenoxybenzoativorans]|uniref:Large polyvalent protein-associated domain-containing protein n=1 Tax=Sphingobium phenoxybenzoativorans TaxID=1592790 RepID=A0A975K4P4_9SPHN|nr:LPD38 domain-containing protein [Sphingobium phenoxybenzoativorans]QUT04068.1 hypothetical protein KFK14_13015 [Sphingobium phenoxybenzoativorans]
MSLLDDIRASQSGSRPADDQPLSLLDAIRAQQGGKPDTAAVRRIIDAPIPRSEAESRARDNADRSIADASKDEGFFDRAGSIVSRAADDIGAGLRRVGGAINEWSADTPLPWTSQENLDRNRQASQQLRGIARQQERVSDAPIAGETTLESFVDNPSIGAVPGLVSDLTLGSVPGMAVSLLAPPISAASYTGNIAQARAENNGETDADIGDVGRAAPAGLLAAILDRYGAESIIGAQGGNAAIRIGRAALGEGLTEGAQEGVQYTGETLGTDKGFDLSEGAKRSGMAALGGGIVGGALRGGEEIGSAGVHAVKPGKDSAPVDVVVTDEDVASPIPTDMIAKGRGAIVEASGPRALPSPLAEADAIDARLRERANAVSAPTEGGVEDGLRSAPPSPTPPSGKPTPIDNAKAVTEELFPGARVTSWNRSADDPLTKANPTSWHAKSKAAIDMAPIKGMTFEQARKRYEDAGYTIIEALNETGAGRSKHATGDHWHFVLGKGDGPAAITTPEPQKSAPSEAEPAVANTTPVERETSLIPPDDAPAGGDLRGEAIDKDWVKFTPESGTLDIPRDDMPQIKSEHRGAMVNFLRGQGIAHEEITIPSSSLKPTQREFSSEKVAAARAKASDADRAILISSDGHVLDGHHQWLAKRDAGEDVRAIRLDAPIAELVDTVKRFPSATDAEGSAFAAEPDVQQAVPDPEPPATSPPPADPDPAAPPSPSPPSPSYEITPGGSLLVRGASDADLAAIREALPKSVRPIPHGSGGVTFPKRYQNAVKAAIEGKTKRTAAPRNKTQDLNSDVLTFIAANGGIRDDENHSLRKGRNLQRFIPGKGALIRPGGRSIDYVRERLVEAGWLPEDATESDTLDLIERGHRSPVYHPESDRGAREAEANQEPEDEARERVVSAANDIDIPGFDDADIDRAIELMSDGLTAEEAIIAAIDEAASREYGEFLASTGDDIYDIDAVDEEGDTSDTSIPAEVPAGDAEGVDGRASDAGAARQGQDEARPDRRPEPLDRQPAGTEPLYDEDGAQIGWLDTQSGQMTMLSDPVQPDRSMTQAQRSELEARQQQSMARRGGQEAVSDQDGGLFSAERDQGGLFSIPDLPTVAIQVSDWGKLPDGATSRYAILKGRVLRWYKGLIGTTVMSSDGREVRFNRVGAGKLSSAAGEDLLMAARAIPKIIERGQALGPLPGDRTGVKAVHRYAANVRVGDQVKPLMVFVRETDGGTFQYSFNHYVKAPDASAKAEGDTKLAIAPAMEGDAGDRLNLFLLDEQSNNTAPDASGSDRIVVRQQLADRVRQLGLGDRVTVNVTDVIEGRKDVAGRYWNAVIDVALRASQDPETTFNHEAVHAFKDFGLFLPPEWKSLESAARADRAMMGSIRKRYPSLSEEAQVEEAIADRYARWARGQKERGFVARAFERVRDFLRGVGQVLRGQGFTTAESVMRAMERGDIGSREPEVEETVTEPRYSITSAIDAIGQGQGKLGDAVDRWRTALQDRYLPLLRTQQTVEQQLGRPLTEAEDVYLSEELMSGRIGARLQALADDVVEPLLSAIHEEGTTPAELEEYLYARHAPERNAQIAKINPTFQEGEGSGMTDAEAAAVMASVEKSGKKPALDRLAARVDKMLADALQTRVDGGLMSEADANIWKQQYQSYVPLRGQGLAGMGTGLAARISQQSGLSVKGKESKQAFGRKSKADNILAYAVMQAEEAIVRAEKNRVAQSFLELAKAAPDPGFCKVNKIERRAVFNKASGQVQYQNQSRISAEDAPYTVSAKVDGVEHRITMDRTNPAAVRLATSMRNLNEQQVEFVVKYMGAVNRFLSTVNTSWNPEFVITNAFRDIQTASINLGAEKAGMVSGTLRDYRKALAASVKGSFGKGSGEWDRWYRDFVMDGGRVYFNNVEDLDEIKGRLAKSFKAAGDKAAGRLSVKRGLVATRDFIDNLNNGVENAIRLAAYKNAVEAGMSRRKAASLAKNLTVNFNRRGSFGPLVNSMYLFFNAGIQGTTRLFTAMKSPKVRKVLAGVALTGAALEIMNALVSGDDDDGESFYDKISAFDKSRNLIIVLPGGKGDYIKIPLPYGYNVFHNAGRTIAEIARRGGNNWQASAADFAGSVVDAFNPIGGTESLLNFIAPTIADPFVDLQRNRDFADRPIMPEQNQFGPQVPNAQRYFNSVSPIWKGVTDALTALTGGDDVVAGNIDVSPETLEYLSGVVFGAAGAFVERNANLTAKLFDPEAEVDSNDLPLARKVIGSKPSWYDKSAYYDRVNQVETAVANAKDYLERGRADDAREYASENKALFAMIDTTKAAKKQVRAIRKERNAADLAHEIGRIDDAQLREVRDRLKTAEDGVIAAYNTRWNKTVLRAKEMD